MTDTGGWDTWWQILEPQHAPWQRLVRCGWHTLADVEAGAACGTSGFCRYTGKQWGGASASQVDRVSAESPTQRRWQLRSRLAPLLDQAHLNGVAAGIGIRQRVGLCCVSPHELDGPPTSCRVKTRRPGWATLEATGTPGVPARQQRLINRG